MPIRIKDSFARVRRILGYILGAAIIVTNEPFAQESDQKMQAFSDCMNSYADQERCLNLYGRSAWSPVGKTDPEGVQNCAVVRDTLKQADKLGWDMSWKILFFNERCFRLGLPHY